MSNILTRYFQLKNKKNKNNNGDMVKGKDPVNKNNPRKTYKRQSKFIRKIQENPSHFKPKKPLNGNKTKKDVIKILMNSPKIEPLHANIKHPITTNKLRKSGKTSKKDKKLKKDYIGFKYLPPKKNKHDIYGINNYTYNVFDSNKKSNIKSNIKSNGKSNNKSNKKSNKKSNNTLSGPLIYNNNSYLTLDLDEQSLTYLDCPKNAKIIEIKAMRDLLLKIKEENHRIEQLLETALHIEDTDTEEEEDTPSVYKCLKNPMTTIKELIKLGEEYENYKDDTDTYFNIDLKALSKMKEPLLQLDAMVGLKDLKNKIIEEVLVYIQKLHDSKNDFLHTALYGKPGVGKTELGNIIGRIYSSLGFLSSGHVIEAHADDFIGTVVGQTSVKTRELLEKALGGVLIIDEAYALGHKDGRSYVEDFISTLLPFLTEHRNDFVCILIGYKKEIEHNLFNKNKGLKRRFQNIYNIRDYNMSELRDILIKKINDYGWYYNNDAISLKLFEKYNKEYKNIFTFNGGSIEQLFKHIKLSHSKRVLYYPPEKKKTINYTDFENGLISYNNTLTNKENSKNLYSHIYS